MVDISKNSELFRRDQYDDPNTITNKLLLALRQLDFKGSFPSQKLRTPYGDSACMVLEFLADKALDNRGFKYGQPVYSDSVSDVSPRVNIYITRNTTLYKTSV